MSVYIYIYVYMYVHKQKQINEYVYIYIYIDLLSFPKLENHIVLPDIDKPTRTIREVL